MSQITDDANHIEGEGRRRLVKGIKGWAVCHLDHLSAHLHLIKLQHHTSRDMLSTIYYSIAATTAALVGLAAVGNCAAVSKNPYLCQAQGSISFDFDEKRE